MVPMDTQEGVALAITAVEQHGVALTDFGFTWGPVFLPQKRKFIAALRQEKPTPQLARASLFASWELALDMWPLSMDSVEYYDLLRRSLNTGFLRFPYDPNALAFVNASKDYIQAVEEFCVNEDGEVQVFPLLKHPLADGWVMAHPREPALAVRSANLEGMQEQAIPSGVKALAKKFGQKSVFVLSAQRQEQIEHDERIMIANGLTITKEGFAQGTYQHHEGMLQKAFGSVSIFDAVKKNVSRPGNLHPDTIERLYSLGAPDREITFQEGMDRPYRTQLEIQEEESWRWLQSMIVYAAGRGLMDPTNAENEINPARPWRSRRQA